MDPQVQGSFIPKQSLTAARQGSGPGLFLLIALLVFATSLLAAGGVFGYSELLKRSLADKDNQLKTAEGAFDALAIQDLVRTDKRLIQAQTLLQRHVAPSALLFFLGTITLERVQFTAMDFSLLPDGSATLSLTGAADSFSGVALQSDQFGASKVLRDVIFSGINVSETGKVNFTVNAAVEPDLILYSRNLSQASPQ